MATLSPRLSRLNLSNFRNHPALRMMPGEAFAVVLAGPNGSGKTNILEAVSLLGPGRGLRASELAAFQSRGMQDPWAVSAEVLLPGGGRARLGTGLSASGARRVARLDGRDIKSHAEFAAVLPAVWLTPQMDGLFTGPPAERRRFLDRLISARDPQHAGRLAAAEKNARARLKILTHARETGARYDETWIATLEAALARDHAAIDAARRDMTAFLNEGVEGFAARLAPFALPLLNLTGDPAQEDDLASAFRDSRALDAAAGRMLRGAHRADLAARLPHKDMPAAECSTGEQKGMLAALVLAHALLLKAEKGFAPLILLDEVAAHLDEGRKTRLLRVLNEAGGQAWLTGTDAAAFAELSGEAAFFHVENGRVEPAPHHQISNCAP
jgi:DNA replication and repair protein RecF